MKSNLPVLSMVPAATRQGQEVCVFCTRVLEPGNALCAYCGRAPVLREARNVAYGLTVPLLALGAASGSGICFALSLACVAAGGYLQSKQRPTMEDNRRVFLPLAGLAYLSILFAGSGFGALGLALLGTAFTYIALPSLHSPHSLDPARGIEEFEQLHGLGYGFGPLREQIRSTIAASEDAKQSLLVRELLPRIDRLLDEKLLGILKRKVNLEKIIATTDPALLEEERKRAIKRATTVKSDAVRGELARSAALSRSMIENYQRIADLLNVYNVQISNLQKVLANLNMKIAATAFDDGSLGALREPLDALDREMDLLESSFRAIDLSLEA